MILAQTKTSERVSCIGQFPVAFTVSAAAGTWLTLYSVCSADGSTHTESNKLQTFPSVSFHRCRCVSVKCVERVLSVLEARVNVCRGESLRRLECSADGSTHTESNKLYRKVKHGARPNLSSRQRPKRAPIRRRSRRRQRRGAPHTEHGLGVFLHLYPYLYRRIQRDLFLIPTPTHYTPSRSLTLTPTQ